MSYTVHMEVCGFHGGESCFFLTFICIHKHNGLNQYWYGSAGCSAHHIGRVNIATVIRKKQKGQPACMMWGEIFLTTAPENSHRQWDKIHTRQGNSAEMMSALINNWQLFLSVIISSNHQAKIAVCSNCWDLRIFCFSLVYVISNVISLHFGLLTLKGNKGEIMTTFLFFVIFLHLIDTKVISDSLPGLSFFSIRGHKLKLSELQVKS